MKYKSIEDESMYKVLISCLKITFLKFSLTKTIFLFYFW